VAHTYNPSYSGSRDQEDTVRSQLGQIVHKILSWKKTHHKKGAGGVAQDVGPEFKPAKKKKRIM
jgi:hypothetical protein